MSRRLIFLMALVALMTLALAACGGGSSGGGNSPLNVSMTATEFKYDPNVINASPGQTINLTVKNIGSVQHTWVLDQGNIKMTIDPGKSETKTFTAPTAPGTYQFYCDEPGHKEAGMVGQLIVK
jgi:plastocyanin